MCLCLGSRMRRPVGSITFENIATQIGTVSVPYCRVPHGLTAVEYTVSCDVTFSSLIAGPVELRKPAAAAHTRVQTHATGARSLPPIFAIVSDQEEASVSMTHTCTTSTNLTWRIASALHFP
jgi:hypothetical protein